MSHTFASLLRACVCSLLALVVSSAHLTAQTDTVATSINKAAMAAFRDHPNAARSSAVASRPLVINPIVLPYWYDNGVREESSAMPLMRDSAYSAVLATALGSSVASRTDVAVCTPADGGQASTRYEECKLLDVVIVSVGEPRHAGNEAALMVRTTSPLRLANGSITVSRYGSTYLMRLTRADGTWRVRCMTNLPDTSDSRPEKVAERCRPA